MHASYKITLCMWCITMFYVEREPHAWRHSSFSSHKGTNRIWGQTTEGLATNMNTWLCAATHNLARKFSIFGFSIYSYHYCFCLVHGGVPYPVWTIRSSYWGLFGFVHVQVDHRRPAECFTICVVILNWMPCAHKDIYTHLIINFTIRMNALTKRNVYYRMYQYQ